HAGDPITLNGRAFHIVGVAVSAAVPPYPEICRVGCNLYYPQTRPDNTGLMWLTTADVRSLATPVAPLSYFLYLKLADPAQAQTITHAHNFRDPASTAPFLTSWQSISQQDGTLVKGEQLALLVGSWLLALLAVASVAVLVGGRIAEQIRRVGLLKAVGGTPALVASVLLTQYFLLAGLAAAGGLTAGWLTAPLLTGPGAGLLGTAGAPSFTIATVEIVLSVALAVAAAAAVIPTIRAARTSTVRALADSARPPRRRAVLIKCSAHLPVPLLLAVRILARRPRRATLNALSVAVTVSGIVAVLFAHLRLTASQLGGSARLNNPRTDRANQVLLVITILLITLAAVNVLFITRATVTDTRHSTAVTRALGATPEQVAFGLAAAQLLPALAGLLVGIPGGIGLYAAIRHGEPMSYPPTWWLTAVAVGTLAVVALLTALPARIGARRPVADILQSELA
ncbi:MAG: ABC transporter permease, partial [Mycobacteriales bacterium]